MNALLSLEVAVLAQGREWTRQQLEGQAQKQIDDWGVYCPQSGELLKCRKRQRLRVMTCVGTFTLREKVESEPEQTGQALRSLPGVRRVGKLPVLEFWVAFPRVHLGLACRKLQSRPNPQKKWR